MRRKCSHPLTVLGLLLLVAPPAHSQKLVENLGRGLVAVPTSGTEVYVGWRLLGTDPATTAFNLYRTTGDGDPVRLNASPITQTTDFVDTTVDLTKENRYFVRPLLKSVELQASAPFTLPVDASVQQYVSVPIQRPPNGSDPLRGTWSYSANDGSIGDLDGDGQFEIVLKWDPSNARDTASTGYSGNQVLDAYKLDGTLLWRIDLGRNIRSGAHYTQFMVYDFDGDGKAEVAGKTADGAVDGRGNVIGDPNADWISRDSATRGRILTGPEYLTVFDGMTGAALATTDYVPSRLPLDGWGGIGGNGNNDNVGNRVDRFLAAVAYLDGQLPSLIMCRGYYGRSVLAAWDWRNGQLTQRWVFDSGISYPPYADASPFSGQGNHNISVADVDGDGKDEIVYGSMVIDDDGAGAFSTGLRHGDAMHVGDLIPSRPGLEVYGVHESEGRTLALQTPGMALYDAGTGQIIWSFVPGVDVGRGLAADIDPRYPGYEFWGSSAVGLVDTQGQRISDVPSSTNFAVWWDADLLREIEDGNWISKWDWDSATLTRLLTATGSSSNNGTKATPVLSGDLLGDWREEVIWRTSDNQSLRIYTTAIPADNRIYTLLHDPQYRVALAWQNVAYNQPPHPSFFLGDGMSAPPIPNIIHADTMPPAFKSLDASPGTLRPPNHKMVDVTVSAEVVDLIDGAPTARIVSVSSDEPVDGTGDGDTSPDWEITGDLTLRLRAERAGTGSGRVYTITVEARDYSGNTTLETIRVTVPKNRSDK